MKTLLPILLAVSLVLNAVVIALFFRGSAAASGEAEAEAARAATTAAMTPASKASAPAAAPAFDPETWSNLETSDLNALVTRLRAGGFPIEMIRAILAAQLNESFAARRKAIDPEADKRPFWKSRPTDPRIEIALQQTYRDQQKAMREVLGDQAEADDASPFAAQGRRLEGLPDDKAREIKRLLREFDEKRQEFYATGTSNMDREKIQALEKAQHDAIARVLTPQELVEYDLRNSNTASSLRYELTAFNPTEQEFRALHRLRQPYDEQFNTASLLTITPEVQRQRTEAHKLLTEQIKAALTPDRAAEYERATDYSYRQTSQLVARLELAPAVTGQIYDVQKDILAKINPIFSNRALSPEERTVQLLALNAEAQARITPILGARGFEAYKQYGGDWMRSLLPRPTAQRAPVNAVPAGGGGRGGGG